jgi:oxygen-independent coproporphyrinogen-3 oxidase
VSEASVGVYVHVPFCERICPYCDFPVVAARRLPRAAEDAYVEALLDELELRRGDFAGHGLASVYFGGGTPSLLHPDAIARLVDAVRAAFPAPPGLEGEITLEVNPSTLERERLPGFRAAGANRLSIGIQSFDDGVLKRLGRAHRAEEGRASLRAARAAGFANVSLDLIFAAPGQSLAGVDADLDEAVAFGPEHLSAYALTVEPGTPYAGAVARGRLALPAEDEAAAMMERVPERLAGAGLVAYEISNLARPGFESAHNRRYWERRPVLGLGVGAWSTEPRGPGTPHGARRANRRDLAGYLACVREGVSPAVGPPEVLDPRTARGEAALLALRTRRGLRATEFAAEFGAPPRRFFGEAIDRFRAAGLLLEAPEGDLRLSARGRLLADSVCEAFV